MDVCICRQLSVHFEQADRMAEVASKASSNANTAQMKAKELMWQLYKEYEERRSELDDKIAAQKAELSAGRSQLVTHCCCCAMLCKLDRFSFENPNILSWPFSCLGADFCYACAW